MTVLRTRTRDGAADLLGELLRSDHFRLGRGAARVARNLADFGGVVDARARAFIGAELPPHGFPSVSLGDARGTLGPHSFGFLANAAGVAALAGALPARPRVGPVALVCGRRDALPDLAPLCVARDLGVSWIISTGDGPVDDVLAFLAADEGTRAVLLATPRARPAAIAALAGKPVVALGGEPRLRAAVRSAGGLIADDLETWLAHAALAGAGPVRGERTAAVVVGGGAQAVEATLRAAGLPLAVTIVEDDDPEEIARALGESAAGADLLLAIGAAPLPLPPSPSLFIDVGHPERLRAVAIALRARRELVEVDPAPAIAADRTRVRAILAEAGDDLADHDVKRLLKCYGVPVTRQAPANSATAAVRIGAMLGYPVDVVAVAARTAGVRPADPAREPREHVRSAHTASELRHVATLLLDGGPPYVLVREALPAAPRARIAIRRERGAPAYATAGAESALLPLSPGDSRLLARACAGDDASAIAELLRRACACADDNGLALGLEVFTGARPVVVAAAGHTTRRP